MSRKIRVAAIQATSLAANWEEKWQGIDIPHAVELLEQAASGGADLACFPELYPLAGRGELCEAARRLDVHVIAGLAEGEPPKWQNTSTVISNDGTVLGVQTKNYPTALEVDRGVVPGDAFPVFESDLGRIGIVICADFAFFHDGVEANCRHRADMIFNPALWFALSEAFPHTVIGRHMEYSVPVFGVNIGRPREGFRDSIFPPAGDFPRPACRLRFATWTSCGSGSATSPAGSIRPKDSSIRWDRMKTSCMSMWTSKRCGIFRDISQPGCRCGPAGDCSDAAVLRTGRSAGDVRFPTEILIVVPNSRGRRYGTRRSREGAGWEIVTANCPRISLGLNDAPDWVMKCSFLHSSNRSPRVIQRAVCNRCSLDILVWRPLRKDAFVSDGAMKVLPGHLS